MRAERLVTDKLGATFEVVVTDRHRNRAAAWGRSACPCWASTTCRTRWPPSPSGIEMEIDDATLRSAFAGFRGVKRRFTKTGESGGITVIDDYGHHPVEIAAVLKAARQAGARDVVAVVQPHRYSRLHSLFAEFCTCMNDAGTVIVADVYAAGEAPIPGVTRDALVDGLRARGHRSVVPLPGPEHLAEMVHAIAKPGDFVVCLGAGNITAWAQRCPRSSPSCRRRARAAGRHDGAASPALRPLPAAAARPRAGGRAPGPDTWFRVGGPAEALVRPADAGRPRAFLPPCRSTCR